MTSLRARRLQALPKAVAPLHRETWDSYVKRLAAANGVELVVLHQQLGGPHRITPKPLPLLEAVSDLSGQPRRRLLRALMDIGPATGPAQPVSLDLINAGWVPQEACTRCTRAKGVLQPARRWVRVGTQLCLKHQHWTAGLLGSRQFDTGAFPEIARAQRRYYRLARRHGWRAANAAMREVTHLGFTWWEEHMPFGEHPWRQRLRTLDPSSTGLYEDDPTVFASAYPEAVALAGVFASSELRQLPFTGHEADLARFLAEIRTRAAPGYVHGSDRLHPLVRWIDTQVRLRALIDPLQDKPWPWTSLPNASSSPAADAH